MAASDIQTPEQRSVGESLPADMLVERLEEEIARAERHRSALSCLLVGIEDLDAIGQAHGNDLSEQALAYVGLALRREFRRYLCRETAVFERETSLCRNGIQQSNIRPGEWLFRLLRSETHDAD